MNKIESFNGDKLKALRIDMGLSQEATAMAIGISRYRLGDLEKGKSKPDSKEFKALCNLFNATPIAFGVEKIKSNYNKEMAPIKTPKAPQQKSDKKQEKKEKKEPQDKKWSNAYYKPTMQEMPERLDLKGTKSLIYAMLNNATVDARDIKRYKSAEAFVNSSWCLELCEGINLDYKTYRNHLLNLSTNTGILGRAAEAAKDIKRIDWVKSFIDSDKAREACEKIDRDYNGIRNYILSICYNTKEKSTKESGKGVELSPGNG